jgi:hypothetical protein
MRAQRTSQCRTLRHKHTKLACLPGCPKRRISLWNASLLLSALAEAAGKAARAIPPIDGLSQRLTPETHNHPRTGTHPLTAAGLPAIGTQHRPAVACHYPQQIGVSLAYLTAAVLTQSLLPLSTNTIVRWFQMQCPPCC